MNQYTELLDIQAESLSPDDDFYEEKLLAIAALFKGFNEALTAFLIRVGYSGDTNDAEAKAKYIRTKFKEADIAVPRDVKSWFDPGKSIGRDTAFQICFAFGMSVEETNDFFRRVYFERSFDCHSISEAVYYFCIRNGLNYQDAQQILARMPSDKKGAIKTDREVLYTGTIMKFVNGAKSADELIAYVNEHLDQFGYNNATATKHIQDLWNSIACEDGLAYKEGCLIDKAFNRYHEKSEGDEDDYTVVTQKADSIWRIYSQILGLDKHQTVKYGAKRTIKPLLVNNELLPPLAEGSFPDRDGIEKITKGAHVSHERIRKTMILLEFYTYWAQEIVKAKDAYFEATKNDAERCIDKINRYLLEASYPELYYGNPYDWIFLWAVNDGCPLLAFREYIAELIAYKADQLVGQATE